MTVTSWSAGASGDWGLAGDWTSGVPANTSFDAVVSAAGAYTVTLASAETFSIHTLTVSNGGTTLLTNGGLSRPLCERDYHRPPIFADESGLGSALCLDYIERTS
jgi:hypothetical protein